MSRIMIVDDSNLMISVLRNFIGKSGKSFDLVEVRGGEEAIQKYKESRPDLVFMDIMMPGMDGLTALGEIKKIDRFAKVVMCTSLKEAEQEKKAQDLGAVGYITKPFSSEDIIREINKNI